MDLPEGFRAYCQMNTAVYGLEDEGDWIIFQARCSYYHKSLFQVKRAVYACVLDLSHSGPYDYFRVIFCTLFNQSLLWVGAVVRPLACRAKIPGYKSHQNLS